MLKSLRKLLPVFRVVRTPLGTFTLCHFLFISYEAVFLKSGVMFAQFGPHKKNFFLRVPKGARTPTVFLSSSVETVFVKGGVRLGTLKKHFHLRKVVEALDAKIR